MRRANRRRHPPSLSTGNACRCWQRKMIACLVEMIVEALVDYVHPGVRPLTIVTAVTGQRVAPPTRDDLACLAPPRSGDKLRPLQ